MRDARITEKGSNIYGNIFDSLDFLLLFLGILRDGLKLLRYPFRDYYTIHMVRRNFEKKGGESEN